MSLWLGCVLGMANSPQSWRNCDYAHGDYSSLDAGTPSHVNR
jgi:hypothetical protein